MFYSSTSLTTPQQSENNHAFHSWREKHLLTFPLFGYPIGESKLVNTSEELLHEQKELKLSKQTPEEGAAEGIILLLPKVQRGMGKGCMGGLDANKFIMKVSTQRNPYLRRVYPQQPHKYSYDIDKGKLYLLDETGSTVPIHPNGTFHPKFRPNFSGFVNHHPRYEVAQQDPSALHFAPDPNPNTSYHNPMPDKFAGYAQFPYKLKPDFPPYLKKHDEPAVYPERKKAQSLLLPKASKQLGASVILDYTATKLPSGQQRSFFNEAWESMSNSKPLPRQKKRTCYNYKCKNLKQWVFDERGQTEAKLTLPLPPHRTLGRSFHQTALSRQAAEGALLSTMCKLGSTGVGSEIE